MNSSKLINEIPFEIIRKKNQKNIYVRVKAPNGVVVISAPNRCTYSYIDKFIEKEFESIISLREKVLAQKINTTYAYVTGEKLPLWGIEYTLKVIIGSTRYNVEKLEDKIILKTPNSSTKETREKAIDNWYKRQVKMVLDNVIQKCEGITNLSAKEYKVRKMKTRWGSCNTKKQRIWLNSELAKKPIECLEYVLIHELSHLLEANHSSKFYVLMDRFCPNWREIKKKMK